MVPSVGQLFLIGVGILNTTVDLLKKTLLAQLGSASTSTTTSGGAGTVVSDGAEWWQHVGFCSRPPNPASGASAQAIAVRQSDRDVIIASRDNRANALQAVIGPGETCLYAAGADGSGQARLVLKGDHSVALISTDPVSTFNTLLRLDGANQKIEMQAGSCMIKLDGVANKITITAGGAALTLNGATGRADLVGQLVNCQANGIACLSGGVATCLGPKATPPLPASACLLGPAGASGVPSTNVFVSLTP